MQALNECGKDWRDTAVAHYSALYRTLPPDGIAERCGVPFDTAESAFFLRIMGDGYLAAYPVFALRKQDAEVRGAGVDAGIRVLVLRFLCGGKKVPYGGRQLSFADLPWGRVYASNFERRCIMRAERVFGGEPDALAKVFERQKGLRAEKLDGKECGWRFEFISGIFMSIIIWRGDDEFPSKAQILFDDNFPAAFSAEDAAVAGDICINRLKELKQELKDEV
jgi:hypothetical protein